MGTECLPPSPFWVSFLHPPFKPDPKKGEFCSAPRQWLRSRITKAHLIRIDEFQRPEEPMRGELASGETPAQRMASVGRAAASFRMQDDRWRSGIVRMAASGILPPPDWCVHLIDRVS